jgi:hypothetical protein
MSAEPQAFRDNGFIHGSEATLAPMSNAPLNPRVPACKEWAVIVRALLTGEQILDVRKGGIREPGRHFGLASPTFWLMPTVEHQRAELLKPAYERWVEETELAAPPARGIRIAGFADVVGVATVTDADPIAAIGGGLIWSAEYAASRLHWKRRDPLWVLLLRAYRLDEPIDIAWRNEYGGCSSWVDLPDLPADPRSRPHHVALSDEAFAARERGARQALEAFNLEFESPA